MLKSTLRIYGKYDFEAKKRAAELAKKTLEQIHREYLEAVFTAARRHRLDIWDFAQKFMESDFSLALDRPEELLRLEMDEVFRDFMIYAAKENITVDSVADCGAGMNAFRTISPEAKWLASIYSRWHAKTGEACCEIAERAPAKLLKNIHKKAMAYAPDEIIELLEENSEKAAKLEPGDYEKLRACGR